MATDDSLVRERPKSTILAGFNKARTPQPEPPEPSPEAESWDDDDLFPSAGSPYEAAYARAGNKPDMTLHVLTGDGFSRGFAWSNYDSVDLVPPETPGGGPVLVVRFNGLNPVEMRIHGSNLYKLRVLIGRQRIAWIREQLSKRGFESTASKPAEVITRIVIAPFLPAKQANGVSATGS